MLKKTDHFCIDDPPKLFAVINSRIKPAAIEHLRNFFSCKKLPFALTEMKNHTGILAANSKDYEGIIVAGGDGTLHEAINGCDLHSQYIVYIPAGSVNCLGRHWKIRGVPDMLSALRSATIKQVDLIEADLRYEDGNSGRCYIWGFAGLGYEGTLTALAQKMRRFPPPLRYMLAAWG